MREEVGLKSEKVVKYECQHYIYEEKNDGEEVLVKMNLDNRNEIQCELQSLHRYLYSGGV